MSNVVKILQERGFVDAITSEDLIEACDKPIQLYCGFDPTADSLHLGNLVGIVLLSWFQKFGHTPMLLLGGGTGRIGDPSGKDKERPLLDVDTLNQNVAAIERQVSAILDSNGKGPAVKVINNYDWLSNLSLIDFMRDVGKFFRLGPMLGKESVKARLHSEEGMSFTEFSYQLLQGYDFYHLFEEKNVLLQVGGSDQWGNITAGIDLIRKKARKSAYGLTFPLLTRSDGKKFGKSEEGAIWLSQEKTSAYQFYQHLLRISDQDVIPLLRFLTFLDMEEIKKIELSMQNTDYVPFTAQKILAREVTLFVHGQEALQTAIRVTEKAAPGKIEKLDLATLEEIGADMPHTNMKREDLIEKRFIEICVASGLLSSKSEATRLIQNGGAYLNNEKVTDSKKTILQEDIIGEKYLVVGSGKKRKLLIKIQG